MKIRLWQVPIAPRCLSQFAYDVMTVYKGCSLLVREKKNDWC